MKFAYAPESVPLPGYTIKRAIDRGGFGEVYFGISDSGKEVALKLLQHNQEVELRGVRYCLNLKHPNIVSLYDIRTDVEGDVWVVMEYVRGRSLDAILAEAPNGFPANEVEQWLSGIAEGVGFLHERGIVHRDLKPANVFRENGIVKVGDVGLAKIITPSKRSAQTESVGTVYYMAPEVARGKYGCELDVYSLGVMTYEMLCGKLPFDGESAAEILMKHLTERPDLERLPVAVRPVIARALEKDPSQRTPSVLQLADEFRSALEGKSIASVAARVTNFVDVEHLESQQGRSSAHHDAHRETLPYPHDSSSPGGSAPSLKPPKGGDAKPTEASLHSPDAGPNQRSQAPRKLVGWLAHIEDVIHEFINNPILIVVFVVTGLFVFPILQFGGGGVSVSLRAFLAWISLVGVVSWFKIKKLPWRSQEERLKPRKPNPPRASVVKIDPARRARIDHLVKMAERKSAPVPPRPEHLSSQKPPASPVTDDEWIRSIRPIPWRLRGSAVFSSMGLAVIWSLVATTAIMLFQQYFGPEDIEQRLFVSLPHAVLFAGSTIFGAWGVLFTSKLTEGTRAGTFLRGVLAMPLALLAGWTTWNLQRLLHIELLADSLFPGFFSRIGPWQVKELDRIIPEGAFVVFIGALLGLSPLWKLADSYRKHRLQVGAVAKLAFWGWLLPIALKFNQPWSTCLAASVAVVVQLSASWSPRQVIDNTTSLPAEQVA